MSDAREELARLIDPGAHELSGMFWEGLAAADRILAAGYAKPSPAAEAGPEPWGRLQEAVCDYLGAHGAVAVESDILARRQRMSDIMREQATDKRRYLDPSHATRPAGESAGVAWTEQESGLERVLTNLVKQFPSDEAPDDRVAGTLTFSEVCELRQFVRERPKMRHWARWHESADALASRPSPVDGGEG